MNSQALLASLRVRLAAGERSEALYARLGRELESAIRSGQIKRGEALPGERVLSDALSVSRVTVRKAIDGLVAEGRLVRRPGAGTEVAGRLEKSLSRLTGFSEDIAARGSAPGCVWLLKERGRPNGEEARALEMPFGAFVMRLHRIRTADGVPIALERAAVPASLLPDPGAVRESLYAALEAAGAAPVRAVQRLRARSADATDAEHLRCAPGAALLVMERRCFDAGARLVEFTETRYLGEAYDFITEITR